MVCLKIRMLQNITGVGLMSYNCLFQPGQGRCDWGGSPELRHAIRWMDTGGDPVSDPPENVRVATLLFLGCFHQSSPVHHETSEPPAMCGGVKKGFALDY